MDLLYFLISLGNEEFEEFDETDKYKENESTKCNVSGN